MLRECFNDFIGHLRLERGLSPRTAKAYGSDMELFISYLESLHIDEWEEVRRDDISDFLEADKDHGMEPTTLARDLTVLTEGGYEMKKAVPVDMFPYTEGIETVVLLSHNG